MKHISQKQILMALLAGTLLTSEMSPYIYGAPQKPSITKEDLFYIENMTAAEATRNQMIDYINKMLPKASDEIKPGLYMKLLIAYSGKYMSIRREELDSYTAYFSQWQRTKKGKAPQPNYSKSDRVSELIINTGKNLIKNYPKYPNLDQALFSTAFTLQMRNRNAEAATYYQQLITNYPKSNKLYESYFALGEFNFDNRQYDKALSFYTKVIKNPKSPMFMSAWYKIAWTYYNLDKHNDALAAFKKVVSLSSSSNDNYSEKQLMKFKEESLQDMVAVYVELGDLNGARTYFYSLDSGKYYKDLLIRYADRLISKGRMQDGITVLKSYIESSPDDPKAPEHYRKIIEASDNFADKKYVYNEVLNYVKLYGANSAWAKKNKEMEPEIVDETIKDTQKRFLAQIGQIHKLAQKQQDKQKYEVAANGYMTYLSMYPNTPQAYEARFFAAEIKYHYAEKYEYAGAEKRQSYTQASELYKQTALANTKGKFFKQASKSMLISASQAYHDEWQALQKQKVDLKKAPKGLSTEANNLTQMCKTYLTWKLNDKESKQCLLDSTDIYLKNNQIEQAVPLLWTILAAYPKDKEGQTAGEYLLSIYEETKDLDNVVNRILATKGIANTPLENKVKLVKLRALKALAHEYEKQGKFLLAAKQFMFYQESFAAAPDGDRALINAGLNFEKANELDSALVAYRKQLKVYPKSDLSKSSWEKIAGLEDSMYRFENAAKAYYQLYTLEKDKNLAVKHLYSSALMFMAINHAETENTFRKLFSEFKTTEQAQLACLEYVHFLHDTGNDDKLETFIKGGFQGVKLTPVREIIAVGTLLSIYHEDENINSANILGQRILTISKSISLTGSERVNVAESAYILAKSQEAGVRALGINPKNLNKDVDAKLAALDRVSKDYLGVLATKDAKWGLAALFSLSQLSSSVANDIQKAPLPADIPEANQKVIREALGAKIVKPLQDKAKGYLEQSYDLAKRERVYTPISKQLYQHLNQLDKNKYPIIDDKDIPTTGVIDAQMFVHKSLEGIL